MHSRRRGRPCSAARSRQLGHTPYCGPHSAGSSPAPAGRGTPVTDATGRVITFPLARFYNWRRLGVHVVPAHRYRLTAVYENPTGRHIRDGGMGAVAGLFVPDHGAVWPAVDTQNSLYQRDLAATIRSGSAEMMADMMMGRHADP